MFETILSFGFMFTAGLMYDNTGRGEYAAAFFLGVILTVLHGLYTIHQKDKLRED